jgi:hypothetical protein
MCGCGFLSEEVSRVFKNGMFARKIVSPAEGRVSRPLSSSSGIRPEKFSSRRKNQMCRRFNLLNR